MGLGFRVYRFGVWGLRVLGCGPVGEQGWEITGFRVSLEGGYE